MTVFSNKTLLITRPRQESEAFSNQIQKFNESIRTICGPLFEIENIVIKKDLSETTGVIVTSSNAIRSLIKSKVIYKGPMFCVGSATANLAKIEGYHSVISEINTKRLVASIENSVTKDTKNLVYFRGEEISHDLAGSLLEKQYNVEEVICYRKSPSFLSNKIISDISTRTILGATFFSKQTVNLFFNNIKFIPDGFVAFCISKEVSRKILSLYPHSKVIIRIAKCPTLKEMCKMIVAAPEFAT